MGNDLSEEVIYRKGQAIITHEEESNSSEIINSLMVGGSGDTLVIADHPTSSIDWGRREGFLSASNVPDEWAELLKYGELYLETASIPRKGITASVAKIEGIEPFKAYKLGDWIGWQDSETVRVKGITCSESDGGNLDFTLDLNNIFLEKEILMSQYIERLGQHTQKSSLSEPNNTAGSAPKNHNHRHGALTGLNQDDHPQYLTEERHAESDAHSFIQRVTSLKKNGEESITGDVALVAGNNIGINQDNNLKTLTISTLNSVAFRDVDSAMNKPITDYPANTISIDELATQDDWYKSAGGTLITYRGKDDSYAHQEYIPFVAGSITALEKYIRRWNVSAAVWGDWYKL